MELTSKELIQELKKYCIGFISISKLDEHYSKADYRIFLVTEFGMVTLFYFEATNKIICKSKNFLDKLKSNAIIGKMI